jgi:phosphate transport system substrate-binding protein
MPTMMKRLNRSLSLGAVFALVLTPGCKSEEPQGDPSGAGTVEQKDVTLTGAGATFPYPLYSKWLAEYNRANPHVRINYQSIGSGGGIRQIVSETVDFGASDAPMTSEESRKAPRKLLHVPTTVGAVAVAYNVEGVSSLKLTPDVLADVYLGKITQWNDPKLTQINEGTSLPDKAISVVYRSDGSGTTAVFTDYLSKVSSEFAGKVGMGKSVKWPTGLGAKGNEGVSGQLKTRPGTIGYVELAYASQSNLAVAALKNRAGALVTPKIDAISSAAEGVEMPDTLHASITDAPGEASYPISAFTYVLAYEDAKNPAKGKALAEFLWWAVHDGQRHAAPLHYAPLPPSVVVKVEVALRQLSAGGKKLLSGT